MLEGASKVPPRSWHVCVAGPPAGCSRHIYRFLGIRGASFGQNSSHPAAHPRTNSPVAGRVGVGGGALDGGVDYYEENLFRRQDMKDVSAANTRSATLAQKHGKEYSVFSPMAEKKKARRSSISSNRMADMATKGKSVSPKKKSVSPKKKHHA